MKTIFRSLVCLALVIWMGFLTGCDIHGGGTLASLFENGKATFAFNGTIIEPEEDQDPFFWGVGVYNDRFKIEGKALSLGLQLDSSQEAIEEFLSHKDLEYFIDYFIYSIEEYFDIPQETPEGAALIFGKYTVRNNLEKQLGEVIPDGYFAVFVLDGGEPGPGAGDIFAIGTCYYEYDQEFDKYELKPFYFNCGFIEGGNLQVDGMELPG